MNNVTCIHDMTEIPINQSINQSINRSPKFQLFLTLKPRTVQIKIKVQSDLDLHCPSRQIRSLKNNFEISNI